jgi:hypothetical protein
MNDFLQGLTETLALHKQGSNIFEIKGGNLFPNQTSQKMWQFARGPKHLHLSDGTHTYSFKGDMKDEDTELEKDTDVPLPDMFTNATSKGRAQVHRSDPGSIYFTLQEGTQNPTYTLRHQTESKWKAIPKKRTVKKQMSEPAYIPNINVESVKTGMFHELESLLKQGTGGALDFFNHAAGSAIQGAGNLAATVGMAPGRIGGAIGQAYGGDQSNHLKNFLLDNLGESGYNAGKAGLLGAGAGLVYDQAKRHLVNTPEETEEETGMNTVRRMALPALLMAGTNAAERSMAQEYYNQAALGKTPKPFG